jgi:membrane associated rhomboid family serine protease
MALKQVDPRFTHSRRAASNFRLSLKAALVALGFCWVVLIFDMAFGLGLHRFGLRPGSYPGMIGIITAPLLHAGAEHLLSNTMPLVVSLTAMFYLYPNSSVRAIPLIWIGSGVIAWIIGRPTVHIGASGLVYGLLAYVFIGGILRRDIRSVSVSLLVGFLYGSMIWGVLPIRPYMSWELHLSGAIMGAILAIVFRNWDQAPIKRYDWEEDDSVPDWFPRDDGSEFDIPGSAKPTESKWAKGAGDWSISKRLEAPEEPESPDGRPRDI